MTSRHACLTLLGVLLIGAAGDPPADIVAQRGDVQLTATDLHTLLANSEPALRTQVVATPASLSEYVRQRVLNRTLLNEARAKGWDQRPDVMQRANDARDAAIVQTYLASLVPPDPNFPTAAEVAAFYEANKTRLMLPRQYHLAQILLTVAADAPPSVDAATLRKAQQLRAQAVKPKANFADLARKNSQDTANVARGGDVGWVREDQLLPAVRDVVARMKPNAVSEPVRVPDGWHVVRLLEIREAAPMSLADATPQLITTMRQARGQEAVRDYVTALLRREPIQINDAELTKELAPH
jgi:parvulin-like peptidyl-prolyl isomerase